MRTVHLYVCSLQRYIFRTLLESGVLFAMVSFLLSNYRVLFIHCCLNLTELVPFFQQLGICDC